MQESGILILIDRIDGLNKANQIALLKGRLQKEGVKVKAIIFLNTKVIFFSRLLNEYVAGHFEISPRLTPACWLPSGFGFSVFYSRDRFEPNDKIRLWLQIQQITN